MQLYVVCNSMHLCVLLAKHMCGHVTLSILYVKPIHCIYDVHLCHNVIDNGQLYGTTSMHVILYVNVCDCMYYYV